MYIYPNDGRQKNNADILYWLKHLIPLMKNIVARLKLIKIKTITLKPNYGQSINNKK